MIKRSYTELTQRLVALTEHPSVSMQELGTFAAGGKSYPLFVMHLGEPAAGKLNVTISAGIHGDEPAGVEAVITFVESNAKNDRLLSKAAFTIFPCDNPSGWELGTRENAEGIDLNREFAVRRPAPEAALLMKALEGKCFDLVFEMHEDIDSLGFYMYELCENPSERVGQKIVQALSICGYPLNLSRVIEGAAAECGVIHPKSMRGFRKTHLPKAVFTYRTCGGHVITLEPPASALSLEERVKMELIGLSIALEAAMRPISG